MASTPTREAAIVDAVPRRLLIGGRWQDSSTGATLAVDDPSTGLVIAHIADASVDDARESIRIAHETQPTWAAVPPRERGEILRRAFELMTARADDLALLMTLEMGKPLAESLSEVHYAADFFRWFSEEGVRISGGWRMAPDGGSRLITMAQPVGPCLLVTPWNFPLAMGTRKIGPAIAAGCTIIIKPAKQTPLSMLALAEIMLEAGLPEGVLSVIPTSRASAVVSEIISDGRLRKLSFTGSTEVGIRLAEQSARGVLRTSLELGGNAPFIVFDDADIEMAADEAVRAKLRNNGEACTAANRFYVHSSVLDAFTAALSARFQNIVVGRGTVDGVTLGPLIDAAAVTKVTELVESALDDGARIEYAGDVPDSAGAWCAPMIVTGVPANSRLVREEIFGPVAPIVAFNTEKEVLDLANSSEFGLASYVFTRDLDRGVRVIEGLQAGMVGLNRGVLSNTAAPFGGIKSSGYGREGGNEGISEYLETKYVSLGVR